jgi:hypothetical protein
MPNFVRDAVTFHCLDAGVGMPFVFQHGLGADATQPFKPGDTSCPDR